MFPSLRATKYAFWVFLPTMFIKAELILWSFHHLPKYFLAGITLRHVPQIRVKFIWWTTILGTTAFMLDGCFHWFQGEQHFKLAFMNGFYAWGNYSLLFPSYYAHCIFEDRRVHRDACMSTILFTLSFINICLPSPLIWRVPNSHSM